MGKRHLQQRKGVFDPIIRGEAGVESGRRLQSGLADRGQNLRLHARSC
jgi:hypothetical protein